MYSLEPFKIDLKSLQEGETTFGFQLDDEYFEAIDAPEVRRGKLSVSVTVTRDKDFFELRFRTQGTVTIPCDLCLDDMEQPIETDDRLAAKFGEDYSEEDDVLTVAEDEGILDISWLIYEYIALNIPIRHVHAPGKCNPAMMKVLQEHSASRSGSGDDGEPAVDPRWAALSKLKK